MSVSNGGDVAVPADGGDASVPVVSPPAMDGEIAALPLAESAVESNSAPLATAAAVGLVGADSAERSAPMFRQGRLVYQNGEVLYDPGEDEEEEEPLDFGFLGTSEEEADREIQLDDPVRTYGVGEAASFRRAVFEHSIPMMHATLPKLPWETGIYAQIFGDAQNSVLPGNDFWAPVPTEPIAHPEPASSSRGPELGEGILPSSLPVFAKHVRALCDRDHAETLDLTWTRGLACWLAIFEGSSFSSQVGNYVLGKLNEKDKNGALLCIRDACGIRSPNTVLKRGRDLQAYIKWASTRRVHWWPLCEGSVLEYLRDVEARSGSKFIGKNLVHALKFFKFIFGANFEVGEILGPMLTGRVSRVLASRNPTEQARALTVAEVRLLEDRLFCEKNDLDKYFIGCMLFALYSRARWGDMSSMQSLEFDVIETEQGAYGFVEGRTRIHKTSNTAERKAMYMPYVAPICGLNERPWGLEWQAVLGNLGCLGKAEPYGPICRAPGADCNFTKRALTSEEAGNMLNDYLKIPAGDPSRTTSHSLKATTLVWAARYGLDDKVRSILGHHALKENSMACYSRDLLAKPLRELCGLLMNIKEGRFQPDGTRSGWMSEAQIDAKPVKAKATRTPPRELHEGSSVVPSPSIEECLDLEVSEFDPLNPFNEELKEEEGAEQAPCEKSGWEEDVGEEFVGSASSDDGETEELGSDLDEEAFLQSQAGMLDPEIDKAVEGDLMQNKRSKMLHRRNQDPNNKLQPVTQCGLHGSGFTTLPDGATFSWPKCSKCFKGEDGSKELLEVTNVAKRRRL